MKTFCTFLFVLFVVCSGYSNVNGPGKTYVSIDRIQFSENGIFILNERDQVVPVHQISYDEAGYFFDWFIPGWSHQYHLKCRNCGAEYWNRGPQPCEVCDREDGFDEISSGDDHWER